MSTRGRRRRSHQMTITSLTAYAQDALARASNGASGYVPAVAHLVALVDGPLLDSPLTCIAYFAAGYAMARWGRDATEAEADGLAAWNDADAQRFLSAVAADPNLSSARAALTRGHGWFERARRQ